MKKLPIRHQSAMNVNSIGSSTVSSTSPNSHSDVVSLSNPDDAVVMAGGGVTFALPPRLDPGNATGVSMVTSAGTGG